MLEVHHMQQLKWMWKQTHQNWSSSISMFLGNFFERRVRLATTTLLIHRMPLLLLLRRRQRSLPSETLDNKLKSFQILTPEKTRKRLVFMEPHSIRIEDSSKNQNILHNTLHFVNIAHLISWSYPNGANVMGLWETVFAKHHKPNGTTVPDPCFWEIFSNVRRLFYRWRHSRHYNCTGCFACNGIGHR